MHKIGTGYRLVFIHGAGSDATCWSRQTEFFKEAEAITLPRHRSNEFFDNDSHYTIETYASWLNDWLASELKQGEVKDKFILVGHSMGGAIALVYALTFPEMVAGLVLVGTGARLKVSNTILDTLHKNYRQGVDYIIGNEFSAAAPENLKTRLREVMLGIEPAVTLNDFIACNNYNVSSELGKIKHIPALVMCGSDDVMTPPRLSSFLVENIAGAKIEILNGTGHMLMLEKPDEFNGLIDNFVASLP